MKAFLLLVICAAWLCLGIGIGYGRGERQRDALQAQIEVGAQDCRMFFDDVYKRHLQELQRQQSDERFSL